MSAPSSSLLKTLTPTVHEIARSSSPESLPDHSGQNTPSFSEAKAYHAPSRKHPTRWIRVPRSRLCVALTVLLIVSLSVLVILLGVNLAVAKAEEARLRSVPSNNGVSKLLASIRENKVPRNEVFTNISLLQGFLDEHFTRDIYPIPAHSHNDYLRNIPLYDALQAGCASVEADIWVDPKNSTNLLVGHSRNSLKSARTLMDMYVTPIISILDTINQDNNGTLSGPFTTSPNTTLVLLLDFKMSADVLWPLVQTHLAPFRQKGYLQSWNETTQKIVFGPVTIVASGLADKQPQLVLSSSTNPHHDIFLDAPLLTLPSMANASSTYNISNSYYASTSLNPALKTDGFMPSLLTRPQGYDVFSSSQLATLRNQTNSAQSL